MNRFDFNAFRAMGVLMVFFLAGAMAQGVEKEAPVQEVCPVLPDEKIDLSIYADFQGKRIYFCCLHCKAEFAENPSAYLSVLGLGNENLRQGPTLTEARDTMGKMVRYAGKFHPLWVHFPIALLVMAFLAEALSLRAGWQGLRTAARFNFWAGAAGAVVAAILGWMAAFQSQLGGEMGIVLQRHRWTGTIVAVLAVAALLAEAKARRSGHWTMPVILFALAVLVGVVGHFGATLVYGQDYLNW